MIEINHIPISCINQAAIQYDIPASLIISVLRTENGNVGSASPNKNETYDYGEMQINTVWLKTLTKYGYSIHDLQYNPCLNVYVGTWILAQSLANGKTLWRGIGDYHSHSFSQNLYYRNKVGSTYYLIENHLHASKQINNTAQ